MKNISSNSLSDKVPAALKLKSERNEDKYGDEYPIIWYNPDIDSKQRRPLKYALKRRSVHCFSQLRSVVRFVKSLGISFRIIIFHKFDEQKLLEDFSHLKNTCGYRLPKLEEENFLNKMTGDIPAQMIGSLKVYGFLTLEDLLNEAPINKDELDICLIDESYRRAKKLREEILENPSDQEEVNLASKENAENEFDNFEKEICKDSKKWIQRIDSSSALFAPQILRKQNHKNQLNSELSLTFPAFATQFDVLDKSHVYKVHQYLRGFVNFQNRKQAKEDFIKLARKFYENNEITEFERDYNEYNREKILCWYTKDSPISRLLNNGLRNSTSDSILESRLILKDLERAIKEQYQKRSKNFHGLVYRGAFLSTNEWKKLERNVGKDIEMLGFLSTTQNQRKAEDFVKTDIENKIFVRIIVPPLLELDEQGFAEIRTFSEFGKKEEDEILFNVRSRFKVLETGTIKIDNKVPKIRRLVLLYGAHLLRKSVSECLAKHQLSASSFPLQEIEYCQHKPNNNFNKITNSTLGNEKYWRRIQYENFGEVYLETQDYHRCIEYGNRVLDKLNLKKRRESEKIKTYDMLGKAYQGLGNHQQALEYMAIPLNIRKQFYGEEHTETAISYNNLAPIYHSLEEPQKALEYGQKALNIRISHNGEMHPDTAISFNNVAVIYQGLGQNTEAFENFKKAENAMITISEKKPLDTAISYSNLALVSRNLERYKEALEYCKKVLEILKSIDEENDPRSASVYSNIASVYESRGRDRMALDCHLKALNILESFCDESHPRVINVYENIILVYKCLGEYDKAQEYEYELQAIKRKKFEKQ